ncbi:putative holin-like toxin [Listeria newyorkensis]|uniref:Putative holin-like toxin n=2 Tax=Listeria newyorkensis TaxID=1497681 RepID=A0A841Z1I6_9LIST|nr:putative holin-like toxin [Listeria newyorkensis]
MNMSSNPLERTTMSVAEAIALMIGFGSFLISLIGLVVKIAKAVQKDKE